MDTSVSHGTKHGRPAVYIGVFLVLGVFTAIEVLISQPGSPIHIQGLPLVVALLALMTAKALLVMMFYMHLRYDTKTYSLSLVLPFFMALLLATVVIVASMPR